MCWDFYLARSGPILTPKKLVFSVSICGMGQLGMLLCQIAAGRRQQYARYRIRMNKALV